MTDGQHATTKVATTEIGKTTTSLSATTAI
jgi:hypothetical protein